MRAQCPRCCRCPGGERWGAGVASGRRRAGSLRPAAATAWAGCRRLGAASGRDRLLSRPCEVVRRGAPEAHDPVLKRAVSDAEDVTAVVLVVAPRTASPLSREAVHRALYVAR